MECDSLYRCTSARMWLCATVTVYTVYSECRHVTRVYNKMIAKENTVKHCMRDADPGGNVDD